MFLQSVNPWSQLEIYVLQEEISKQIQKSRKRLSKKDWDAIAAEFNNRIDGVTLREGAIMAAARVSATGEMMHGSLNHEDRKLGSRSLNEIRLQVKQVPDMEKDIDDLLVQVGVPPRSRETLAVKPHKENTKVKVENDDDLPDTEREEETDEDEALYGDESPAFLVSLLKPSYLPYHQLI